MMNNRRKKIVEEKNRRGRTNATFTNFMDNIDKEEPFQNWRRSTGSVGRVESTHIGIYGREKEEELVNERMKK